MVDELNYGWGFYFILLKGIANVIGILLLGGFFKNFFKRNFIDDLINIFRFF
jgi:hypothetical protein